MAGQVLRNNRYVISIDGAANNGFATDRTALLATARTTNNGAERQNIMQIQVTSTPATIALNNINITVAQQGL